MRISYLLVALMLPLAGCIPGMPTPDTTPKTAPMTTRAPKFGSTAELGTLSGFAVGRWSQINMIDPNLGKQYGLDQLEPPTADTTSYWEFNKDGTLVFRLSGVKDVVNGKWSLQGDQLVLEYLTMGGKSLQDAQAQIKKNAETGTQSAIAEDMHAEFIFNSLGNYRNVKLHADQQHMVFPGLAPSGLGDGGMPVMGEVGLERWGPVSDK